MIEHKRIPTTLERWINMFNSKRHPTKEEFETIREIAQRAAATFKDYSILDILMDIEATHCNACKLDLKGLASAKLGDFVHDVGGIRRYLDRETLELTENWVPRFATDRAHQ